MATLKYSRQRESIKEFLRTRTDHPTADVVYENMKLIYPNISLGTVYRNLSLLADLGEIKKLSSFAGADHFDGRTERHCHFMCIRCERIIDLESEGIHHIMDLAGENFKGKITDYSARFFGRNGYLSLIYLLTAIRFSRAMVGSPYPQKPTSLQSEKSNSSMAL